MLLASKIFLFFSFLFVAVGADICIDCHENIDGKIHKFNNILLDSRAFLTDQCKSLGPSTVASHQCTAEMRNATNRMMAAFTTNFTSFRICESVCSAFHLRLLYKFAHLMNIEQIKNEQNGKTATKNIQKCTTNLAEEIPAAGEVSSFSANKNRCQNVVKEAKGQVQRWLRRGRQILNDGCVQLKAKTAKDECRQAKESTYNQIWTALNDGFVASQICKERCE